jgi:hypothetical protein
MKSRILEALSAGIFVAAWLLAVQTIPALPRQVATHFGWDGVADGTGPAALLWALPVIATAAYALMSLTRLIPSRSMNYPVTVTDQNREAVYALGREMLPALKAGTILTILGLEWSSIEGAVRGAMGPFYLDAILSPLVLTLAVTVYYTLKMRAA